MSELSPEYRYVILHIAPGHGRGMQRSPLIVQDDGGRFQLRDDIWIERFDEQFAKDIQKACEPPHHNIDVRAHDRHLYAFVRRVPEIENSTHEGINELFTTVALSRLINPTSTGERHCAKVFQVGVEKSPIHRQFSLGE